MKSPADIGKHRAPPVLVIAGPTASGKSALAAVLADRLRGTVINADAMQVYRDLPILTAVPSAADRARAPHRLFGILPPDERCTAGRWRDLALREIAVAHGERRLPIVVGGTGMYLKTLIEGLAPVPPIPAAIRAAARARLAAIGAAALHAELAARDGEMAARLSPRDTQRLLRAWEVFEATGRSLAEFQRQTAPTQALQFISLLLLPPRATLHAAIAGRCAAMLAAGAVDEVRRLLELKLAPSLPAMKAVGVAELARHLAGELSQEAALELFIRATRQYAKRQVTWFRHQFDPVRTWYAQYSESLDPEMFPFIRNLIDAVPRSV